MTVAESIAIAISVLSFLVSLYVARTARASNRLAEKAIVRSDEANGISREANTMSQTANAYARESNMIAQRMYEAENVISLKVDQAITFQQIASGDQKYLPVLIISVRNEGKIPIRITDIGLNSRDGAYFMTLRAVEETQELKGVVTNPELPYLLQGWEKIEIGASLDTVYAMLRVMHATKSDVFTAVVIDSLGRRYESPPMKAVLFLNKSWRMLLKSSKESEEAAAENEDAIAPRQPAKTMPKLQRINRPLRRRPAALRHKRPRIQKPDK